MKNSLLIGLLMCFAVVAGALPRQAFQSQWVVANAGGATPSGPIVPTNGLAVYWSMRSSGTNVYDEYGANNAVAVASPTFATIYGVHNDGVLLNGSSQWINDGSVVTGFPYSVSAWIKWTSADASVVSFSSGAAGTYFHLGVTAGSQLWLRHFDGTVYQMTYTATLNDGWHHVAAVSASSSNHKMYLDGILVGSTNYSFNAANIGYAVTRVGLTADSTPLYPFNGSLDEVAIWSRALASNEVYEIYSTPLYYP